MTYTIFILATRKPGLSPAEFQDHYDNKHIPLVQSVAGKLFPLSHTRHYIQRDAGSTTSSDKSNAAHPAAIIMGESKDFDYDVYADLTFENEEKFNEFFGFISRPEIRAKLAADEELFLDTASLKAVRIGKTISAGRI